MRKSKSSFGGPSMAIVAALAFAAACSSSQGGSSGGGGTPCTSDAQCLNGQTCAHGKCTADMTCTSDAECLNGQTCDNGACAPRSGSDAGVGTSSSSGSGGSSSSAGSAGASSSSGGHADGGVVCTSGAMCPSGQICCAAVVAGAPGSLCQPKGVACPSTPSGTLQLCASPAECVVQGTGAACTNCSCSPVAGFPVTACSAATSGLPAGSSCTQNSQCADFNMNRGFCTDFGSGGRCADTCTSNASCTSGCCTTTSQGNQVCGPSTACTNLPNGAPCMLGSECQSSLCVNGGSGPGWCSETCTTNAQCPNSPVVMWCAANSAGSHTCWPACTTTSDCAMYGPSATCHSVSTVDGYVTSICSG